MTDSTFKRFLHKIYYEDCGCWIWTGAKTRKRNGYGVMRVDKIKQLSHRMAYQHAYGKIPDGMLVLHYCDEPLCVNPEHLFLGTQVDNMQDMKAKGRAPANWYSPKKSPIGPPIGEKNPKSKLREAEVMEILKDNRPNVVICKDHNVSRQQVSLIKLRKAWKHLLIAEEVLKRENAA